MIFFSNGQFYQNAIGSSIQPQWAVPVDQVHVNVSIFEMSLQAKFFNLAINFSLIFWAKVQALVRTLLSSYSSKSQSPNQRRKKIHVLLVH